MRASGKSFRLYIAVLIGLSVILYAQEIAGNTSVDKNMTNSRTKSIPQSQCGSGKCDMGTDKLKDGISHGSKCGVSETKCGGVSHGSKCGSQKCGRGNQ